MIGVTTDGSPFRLPNVDGYEVMQGGCTDGTYAYLLLENDKLKDEAGNALTFTDHYGVVQPLSRCKLFKVDMSTWQVVAVSEPLDVDHGNGITYNPDTNQLVVAHCTNSTQRISYVDPDNLTVESYEELGRNLYSIAYNSTYKKYVIGVKGSDKFTIYDAGSKPATASHDKQGIKLMEIMNTPEETKIGYQNIYCDDDYIYITYTGILNAVMCYDWSGNYAGVFYVNCNKENEAMFHVGNKYYMSFYEPGKRNGGIVYQLYFDKTLLR